MLMCTVRSGHQGSCQPRLQRHQCLSMQRDPPCSKRLLNGQHHTSGAASPEQQQALHLASMVHLRLVPGVALYTSAALPQALLLARRCRRWHNMLWNQHTATVHTALAHMKGHQQPALSGSCSRNTAASCATSSPWLPSSCMLLLGEPHSAPAAPWLSAPFCQRTAHAPACSVQAPRDTHAWFSDKYSTCCHTDKYTAVNGHHHLQAKSA